MWRPGVPCRAREGKTLAGKPSTILPLSSFLLSWVAECGDIFRQQKASWAHLIPSTASQSAVLAEHFFNTAATLMARQLRDTVKVSLDNFVSLLAPYQVRQSSL